jgi:3-hydroxyisobutyryl-CoA hydrolase
MKSMISTSSTTTNPSALLKKVNSHRMGNLGIVTLHHPQALHALTKDMIDQLQETVLQWCQQNIHLVTSAAPNRSNSSNNNQQQQLSESSIHHNMTSSSSKQQQQQQQPLLSAIMFKSHREHHHPTTTSTIPPSATPSPPPPPPKKQPVRSFCAGGNVKDVYYAGLQHYESSSSSSKRKDLTTHPNHSKNEMMIAEFFRQEYIFNHMLSQLNGSSSSSSSSSSSNCRRHDEKDHSMVDDDDQNLSSNNSTSKNASASSSSSPSVSSYLPIQISIWDGIVMGGGVGISLYGRYRIATEHTLWAMPETNIGLFPDVGMLYLLPRILLQSSSLSSSLSSPNLGLAPYLLLTGKRLHPYDVLQTGIATHYVPSNKLSELEDALIHATTSTASMNPSTHHEDGTMQMVADVIGPVLAKFHEPPPLPSSTTIMDDWDDIAQIFTVHSHTTMEDIMASLQQRIASSSSSSSKQFVFAQQTLDTLMKMSPTSLKITLEGLKRSSSSSAVGSSSSSLQDHFVMEYRLSQNLCQNIRSDFYRGVRYHLVDKHKRDDPAVSWDPSTLSDVTDDYVASFFQPVSPPVGEWELPPQYNLQVLHDDFKKSNHDGTVLRATSAL